MPRATKHRDFLCGLISAWRSLHRERRRCILKRADLRHKAGFAESSTQQPLIQLNRQTRKVPVLCRTAAKVLANARFPMAVHSQGTFGLRGNQFLKAFKKYFMLNAPRQPFFCTRIDGTTLDDFRREVPTQFPVRVTRNTIVFRGL